MTTTSCRLRRLRSCRGNRAAKRATRGKPPACAEACQDAYNDAVQDAQGKADLDTQNENTLHNTQMQILDNTLQSEFEQAEIDYMGDLKTCAAVGVGGTIVSFGATFLTLGLGAGLIVTTAAALATCQLTARGTRDTAKATAYNNYELGVANENARHQGVLQQIANTLQAALDAAQQEFEDCLDDCWEICDWEIICFWF